MAVPSLDYSVAVPIELAKSLEGKYFVGYADNLTFGNGTSAVWTVSDVSESPFRAQFWFNTTPPGIPLDSSLVTPANMALSPLPTPKVLLQYASNVVGE